MMRVATAPSRPSTPSPGGPKAHHGKVGLGRYFIFTVCVLIFFMRASSKTQDPVPALTSMYLCVHRNGRLGVRGRVLKDHLLQFARVEVRSAGAVFRVGGLAGLQAGVRQRVLDGAAMMPTPVRVRVSIRNCVRPPAGTGESEC
jgi:hypothetical protein